MDNSTHSPADIKKAISSVLLGTALEYADFALYGLAAAIIFPEIFFPSSSGVAALMLSFLTFGIGFIARPIGALFFGILGDKYGRKNIMAATIFLMGIATTLIGFIPSFDRIGNLAPVLLAMLRFLQGFGAGAELSGGAIMLGEYAEAKNRGVISSIIGLGSNAGTLLATSIWSVVLLLDKESLFDWGWRLPFIFSFLIVIFALFIRLRVKETPVFMRMKEAERKALLSSTESRKTKTSLKAFFIMLGLRIGENGPSYIAQGFLIGYVVKIIGMDKQVATNAVLFASLLGFLVIPFAGFLSDKFGRRVVYRCLCLALMIYAYPAFYFLDYATVGATTAVIMIGMALGSHAIFGVQASYGVELFGAKNRYTKMALAKEIGSILSGGSAPFIASFLLSIYGTWHVLALYFFIMAGIGFLTTFIAPETRGRNLDLLEDAI